MRVSLRLDLRFSGCLELLLASNPGTGDARTLALLVELAKDATLALDVGANVGLYSYVLAATLPDLRILSVEPVADLAALITDNAHHNGWSSRIAVRQQAVGAAAATATLYVLPGSDTEHTLDADRIAGRDHEPVPVQVVTIDDLLAVSGVPIDRVVLKIDVEGHERATLDGMRQTLQPPGRPPDVIMEFLGRAIHDGTLERVIAAGVDVYYIGPSGITRLHAISDLAPVHTLGYWNFLLTARSPEEVSRIWDRAVGRSVH
jgi:FkbM family methyltransferase